MSDLFKALGTPRDTEIAYNVGACLDIPTGQPRMGMKGEMITIGGVHYMNGIVGKGNVGKTALFLYMYVMVLSRYLDAQGLIYDTENSLKRIRAYSVATSNAPELLVNPGFIIPENPKEEEGKEDAAPAIEDVEIKDDTGQYDLHRSAQFSAVDYIGDDMYALVKGLVKGRPENKADMMLTPFPSRKRGISTTIPKPVLWGVDSLSQLQIEAVEDMKKGKNIGDKAHNIIPMQNGKAKTQMLNELPAFGARYNLCTFMMGHIGKQHQIDPMKPNTKLLATLGQNDAIKGVPEKFLFTPDNVFMVANTKPLYNSSSDKTPKFPRDAKSTSESAVDLLEMTVVSLRNKSGFAGSPFKLVLSQSQGIQPTLSEFYNCQSHKRYGLGGNDTTMYCEIYPEVSITRNTIRKLIDRDPKLCCAIRLTSEILQIQEYWPTVSPDMILPMKDIYKIIKDKGYDWNELLQTRGYWTSDQYTNPVKFLSGYDLLNMVHGLYTPYWLRDKK